MTAKCKAKRSVSTTMLDVTWASVLARLLYSVTGGTSMPLPATIPTAGLGTNMACFALILK